LLLPPPARDPSVIDEKKTFGFIANIPSRVKVGFVSLPVSRRHWVAIRALGEGARSYHVIDSKEAAPRLIGDVRISLLGLRLYLPDVELLVIGNL
jgi:hypothetical protein